MLLEDVCFCPVPSEPVLKNSFLLLKFKMADMSSYLRSHILTTK